MTLLIDIGNTRIKWNTRAALDVREQRAENYRDWTADHVKQYLFKECEKEISNPSRVVISNVGGATIAELISTCMQAEWSVIPEFVRSSAECAGVRNAYSQVENLGVDRWLAMIAVHHLVKASACVVSVGTATTLDGIDASGKHLGGLIVPGPELMIGSLLKNTSDIAARATQDATDTQPLATNTFAAIQQGATQSTVAIIERVFGDLQKQLGPSTQLILTGGGAARIQPSLRVLCRVIPDLVLRGLAILVDPLTVPVQFKK